MGKNLSKGIAIERVENSTSIRHKLMFSAAAGILAVAVPGGLYGMRAEAQALPQGCDDDQSNDPLNNEDGNIDAGETITCVQNQSTGDIDPIISNADSIYVTVGDGATQTRVYNDVLPDIFLGTDTAAVRLSGSGDQTLTVHTNARIAQENPGFLANNPIVNLTSSNGGVVISSDGTIGQSTIYNVFKDGVSLPVQYLGESDVAIDARITGGASDLTIDTEDGTVWGQIYARSDGSGAINLTVGETLHNPYPKEATVDVRAGSATDFVTVTATNRVGNTYGSAINIVNNGLGPTTVEIRDIVLGAMNGVDLTNSTDGGAATIRGQVNQTTSQTPNQRYGTIIGTVRGIDLVTNNGDIRVENLASIAGGTEQGIYARSTGGAITIQNIDRVTSEGGWAIDADTRLSETLQDSNGDDYISYSGGGDITITNVAIPTFDHDADAMTAEVVSANGLRVNSGTGDLMLSAIGDIFVTDRGIDARSDGGTINVGVIGNVSSDNSDGIYVSGGATTGAITIDTQGMVSAENYGINVLRAGTGSLNVTTGGDISTGGDGIRLESGSGGDIAVTVNADIDTGNIGINSVGSFNGLVGTSEFNLNATVSGATTGVLLNNLYAGNTTVRLGANGRIVGQADAGLVADLNRSGATFELSGATGTIAGATYGADISTTNGAITVRDLTSIRGNSEDGIRANSTGGEITIENITAVSSEDGWAIDADTRLSETRQNSSGNDYTYFSGGGDITITNVAIPAFDHDADPMTADLVSRYGISASSGTGDLTLNAIGDVSARNRAIEASTSSGSIDISVAGNLSTDGDGLFVGGEAMAGAITIDTQGTISAGVNGIEVDRDGVAQVDVTTQGAITAGDTGIYVHSQEGGDLNVTVDANITAGDEGIYAYSPISAQDLMGNWVFDVNATVTGGQNGLYITPNMSGGTVVRLGSNGKIIGQTSAGVDILSYGAGASISVSGASGEIEGETFGTILKTDNGAITVRDLTSVRGNSGDGISARSTGGAVTIENIAAVSSQNEWAIDVDTRDYVSQDIYSGGGADVTIKNVALPAFDHDADAMTDDLLSANGIRVNGGTGTINLENIGEVRARGNAIETTSEGGATQISVTGGITSSNLHGIFAYGSSAAGAISVAAQGAISSGQDGVNIRQHGAGAVNVTTDGAIASTFEGIDVVAYAGGDLTVNVNQSIVADVNGIKLQRSFNGVAAATNLNLNASIRGSTAGLFLVQSATSETTIDLGANAHLIGETGYGILAVLAGAGSNLEIAGMGSRIEGALMGANLNTNNGNLTLRDLNFVRGQLGDGARLVSEGGDIAIENIDAVSSIGGWAVNADSRSAGGDGDISIQNITISPFIQGNDPLSLLLLSTNGIRALSGDGSLELTNIGEIWTLGEGFNLTTIGGDITLQTDADIQAGTNGIQITSARGALSADVTGGVFSGQHGLSISSLGANAGSIDVSVDDVSAASQGVYAAIALTNEGASTTELTVTGQVKRLFSDPNPTEAAIDLRTAAGASVTITDSGAVEGNNGDAIVFGGVDLDSGPDENFAITNDTLTLNGTVFADVLLGTGDDTLNYGGTIGTDATIYGGDGEDTVYLTSTSARTFTDFDNMREFENLNFNGDNITLSGQHSGWTSVQFNAGTTTLAENATLEATTGFIALDAFLNARDGTSFIGDLTNAGTLTIGSSPGLFRVMGDFVQTPDGTLLVEIYSTTFDQLMVDGSATLDGELLIDLDLSDLPTENQLYTIIEAGGGVVNQFSDVTDNLPDLDFSIAFNPNGVDLSFVAIDPNPDPDPDPDQGDGDDEDDTPEPEVDEPDPEPLRSAKEIAPSGLAAAMKANDMFAQSLIQRRSSALEADQWSFWMTGFSGIQDVGYSKGIPGWNGDTSGYAFGVERLVDKNGRPILFGIAAGLSDATIKSGSSRAEVESTHIGAFANTSIDALFMAASVSYAWQDYAIDRAIISPTSATITRSDTDGSSLALKTEAFYNVLWSAPRQGERQIFELGPVLTLEAMSGGYDGFKESGAGILNLTYTDEHAYQTVLGLGATGGMNTDFDGVNVEASWRVIWETVAGNRAVETRASLDVANAFFQPSSAPIDASRLAIGTDIKFHLSDDIYAHLRYDSAHSENLIEHEGWAGLTIRF